MAQVISTFSGCGGSSLGYQLAGNKVILAVEWDNNAVETYKLNFPNTPIYHGDIAKLSVEEIFKLTGIKEGELDIFDGSPPCQGFSTAGKRVMNDPRNYLFKEYVRLLRGLKPKVFVMENVSGMVKGKMKLIFADILKELKESGYQVKARLLNAMYFNVPQSRQRIIFIGVRNDLGLNPNHPKPINKPIGCGKIIKSVTPKTFAPENEKQKEVFKYIKQGKSAIQCCPKNILLKYIPRMVNNKTFIFNAICKRIDPNKVCNTITKTFKEFSGPQIHPYEDRYLAIEELQALATFPNSFKFVGNYKEQYSRIGNTVPPNFMRAIAEHINKEILDKIHL